MPWCAKTSDQMRASAIWPTAAAAWLSSSFSAPAGSPSTERPSAIAPEETTSTSAPRPVQRGDVLGERREPGVVELSARPVDEQRRADLEDDAAEALEGGDHAQSGGDVGAGEVVALIQQRHPCAFATA